MIFAFYTAVRSFWHVSWKMKQRSVFRSCSFLYLGWKKKKYVGQIALDACYPELQLQLRVSRALVVFLKLEVSCHAFEREQGFGRLAVGTGIIFTLPKQPFMHVSWLFQETWPILVVCSFSSFLTASCSLDASVPLPQLATWCCQKIVSVCVPIIAPSCLLGRQRDAVAQSSCYVW